MHFKNYFKLFLIFSPQFGFNGGKNPGEAERDVQENPGVAQKSGRKHPRNFTSLEITLNLFLLIKTQDKNNHFQQQIWLLKKKKFTSVGGMLHIGVPA